MPNVTPETISTAVRITLTLLILVVLWEAWVSLVRASVRNSLLASARKLRIRAEEPGLGGQQPGVRAAIRETRARKAVLDRVEHGRLLLLTLPEWHLPPHHNLSFRR